MLITTTMAALTAAAVATSKWIMAAKIMAAVGTGCMTIGKIASNEEDNPYSKRMRRSDNDFAKNDKDTDKSPGDFQYREGVPLSVAKDSADNKPGVYVLMLDGRVMKCGRAAYDDGVSWRLRQYYNLNYDDRARIGDCWSVSEENRDRVTVSWQCCPQSKCRELEYKLFKKYGKGQWAHRAPQSCSDDSWELLI